MQQFFIKGTIPGLNDIIAAAKLSKGKWNKYSSMKKDVEQRIIIHARIAGMKMMPRAFFEFCWCEPNKRRDPDNIAAGKKFILDAITGIVIPDDSQKYLIGFRDKFITNARSPGVLVVAYEKES